MFTKIVVGTDDSPNAHAAVRTAGELAQRYGAGPVHVVTGYRPISQHELDRLVHELPEEFREVMSSDQIGVTAASAAVHELQAMGIEVESHVVPASGAEAILDVAAEIGADLVVVGSHGYGAGQRLLRGSVSTKVAHHAPCSVLIVHGG